MQLLVDHVTRAILAYGTFRSAQPNADVVTVDNALLATLQQPGSKTLNADGTITVDATAVAAAQAAADQQAQTMAARRQAVLNQAQSAVGVALGNLTAAQQRALLACLLYRFGAIDANLVVLPLAQWL